MTMPIAFVDVDSTVADLGTAWLGRYNNDYNDNLTNEDIKSWDTHLYVKPECGKKIYEYLNDPSLYDEVKPINFALEGVEYLRSSGYRVVFPTSTPIKSAGRKHGWLIKHGFLNESENWTKDYIEISDKGLLIPKMPDIDKVNLLIDDAVHNVTAFHGFGILFRRPHNESSNYKPFMKGWFDIFWRM